MNARIFPAVDVSVVIPCYGEEPSLRELVRRIEVAMNRLGLEYEAIVVNDGSVDDTAHTLQTLAADRPWLKVINLLRRSGQTAAMMAGFDAARGGVVVTMDGDLQNDPSDIAQLIAKLDEGFDVVSGWRVRRRDHPIKRVFLSRAANLLISVVTGVRLHDYGCTLKAYRRDILEDVRLYGEMHRFIPIYASWNGARITELPVSHFPRRTGTSNYGLSRLVKVVLDLFVVMFLHRFAQKPIYVFGSCGLVCMAVSAGAAIAMVYYKFWGGKTFIETPLPLLWATMFFTGVLCLLMGLVAEVCMRTYHESQGKRTYRIASTVNFPMREPDGDALRAGRIGR
jgi:glycosyltransferase involved in cell wall biosynthesis